MKGQLKQADRLGAHARGRSWATAIEVKDMDTGEQAPVADVERAAGRGWR